MKTAFFLGAGASKTFGYPLTSEVLPLILQRLLAGDLFNSFGDQSDPHQIDRRRLKVALDRIVPGWESAWRAANADLPSGAMPKVIGVGITDVLTLVDHTIATAEGKGSEGPSSLALVRELLERAIYEVLQPRADQITPEQRAAHDGFARWVFACAADGGVSVITTNYDLTVDDRWFGRLLTEAAPDPLARVDLGFERRDINTGGVAARPARPVGRLLKLHGSLNWLRCPVCGHTYVNPLGDIGSLAFADELGDWNTCHCNPWARLRLPLVTPSLARTVGDRNLESIWRVATKALQEAEEWFIIGYSMPSEDVAIRSLLCRAAGARGAPLALHVIQHGRSAEPLYRALFPTGVYHPEGLGEFLKARAGFVDPSSE